MRCLILLTATLAATGSLRAQLAEPPAGVSEGKLKELTNRCPANTELGSLDSSPVLVRMGRSRQRPLSNRKLLPA